MQNIFTKITQKNTNGSISNVICNSAQKGLIPQREYFDKDIANSDNTDGYFVIKRGDFVYNPRKSVSAPYGPVSVYNYDNDGIVSPLYLCFRPKEAINTSFYEWYFKSSAWHRYVYLYGDSGVRHDRVSIKDSTFFEMPLHIPCAAEQKKLSCFLALLDTNIQKQQQLVDSLKSYKRGVFSQLYDIFLSKAQEVKLCDIVECLDSQRIPINSSERAKRKGIYPYYGANGIQDYIDQYIFDGEFVLLAEDGGHFDDFNENAIAQYVRGKIWVNNHAHILQTNKCNIKFLYYMLEHKDIRSYINGTSRSKLNQEDMMQISISLPSETIQTKIVTLLSGIDNNIILAETIYQELVEYKSGLLQQLFI